MSRKINLFFGFIYFGLIFLGYIGYFFTPLYDLVFGNLSIYIFYYDYLLLIIRNVVRLIIYVLGAFSLSYIYKKINKENDKHQKEALSIKHKLILYIITLVTITIVSLLANWQLKILTDLGEKYNIYNVYVKLSEIAALAGEIYLLCLMIFHFDKFTTANFKSYEYFSFFFIPILLTYSVYSLVVDFSIYQIIFIPFTVALGFIYPFTKRNLPLTYLIVLLVFLF